MTPLMRHSAVRAWSCIKRIFPPYHFSWNQKWTWTMHRWSCTMIEEIPNFKVFIKPYMSKEVDRLVGHTKEQQLCFYIRDDGVFAMQFKLLCTSPKLGPEDGILVWRQDNDEKCMLVDGDPKLYKPNPRGISRKSLKVYLDSLNIRKSCLKYTLPDVFKILMNC